MIPSVGRIVQYTLDSGNAASITYQRNTHRPASLGNTVRMGDTYPMLIVRVWGDPATETTLVNGQVFLDGDDSHWVTSAKQGDGEGTWREFPRV